MPIYSIRFEGEIKNEVLEDALAGTLEEHEENIPKLLRNALEFEVIAEAGNDEAVKLLAEKAFESEQKTDYKTLTVTVAEVEAWGGTDPTFKGKPSYALKRFVHTMNLVG